MHDYSPAWRWASRQVNEPSLSSLLVPFTVDPPCSTAFQKKCALNKAQTTNTSITNTLKKASGTTSKSRLPDQRGGPPPNQPTRGHPSSDLGTRVKQLEEEVTKAKNCREKIISIYRSQFTFLHDRFRALESAVLILLKLTLLRLVFDTVKSATRLDDAAKDTSTHYNSPVYSTHPHGYHFCSVLPICFWTLPLEITPQKFSPFSSATTMVHWHGQFLRRSTSQFAINSTLRIFGPFIIFAPTEKKSFRRPSREPCPTLTNFNFFPQSKIFS